MLDIRRLEILHRFAALGTITATAADLGYSASAISQQLATLEREAGVALIERTAHRASLTDAGRELAEHAALILDATETAQSRMRARAGTISGRVTISCIPDQAAVLAPRLAALQDQHPDLAIVARETESSMAAAAALDRSFDIAVIDDWSELLPAELSGLAVYRLRREQVVLAVPADHALAGQAAPVSAARLRQVVQEMTWLCAPDGYLSRSAGDQHLAAADATPRRRWEFEGLDVLAALAAAKAGVVLLPESVVVAQPGAVAVSLAPRMHRDILVLTRAAIRHDPAIGACLQTIREALGNVRLQGRSGIAPGSLHANGTRNHDYVLGVTPRLPLCPRRLRPGSLRLPPTVRCEDIRAFHDVRI